MEEDIEKGIEKGPRQDTTDQSLFYNQELYQCMVKTASKKMAFGEYSMLHRLNLIAIQNELAECKATIWESKSASEDARKMLRVTLRDYGVELSIIGIHGSEANINNSSSYSRLRLYKRDDNQQAPRCRRLARKSHRQLQKHRVKTL
jgi:hypothetical protein